MKKIGMMVAVEMEAVLNKYGKATEILKKDGFDVHYYHLSDYELYAVHSGAGQIAAAAATQLLITGFSVDFVVNFGVVGGLHEEMKLARTVVVKDIIHYEYDTTEIDDVVIGQYPGFETALMPVDEGIFKKALEVSPDLIPVTCASGEKFIGSPERRNYLRETFDADIVEMEAAAILMTCRRSQVPALFIKTVSDSIHGGADEFTREYLKSADLCLNVTDAIIHQCIL